MILHSRDAMNCGFKAVMITTVDINVIVPAVAHIQGLHNVEQLWISFRTGKDC